MSPELNRIAIKISDALLVIHWIFIVKGLPSIYYGAIQKLAKHQLKSYTSAAMV